MLPDQTIVLSDISYQFIQRQLQYDSWSSSENASPACHLLMW